MSQSEETVQIDTSSKPADNAPDNTTPGEPNTEQQPPAQTEQTKQQEEKVEEQPSIIERLPGEDMLHEKINKARVVHRSIKNKLAHMRTQMMNRRQPQRDAGTQKEAVKPVVAQANLNVQKAKEEARSQQKPQENVTKNPDAMKRLSAHGQAVRSLAKPSFGWSNRFKTK